MTPEQEDGLQEHVAPNLHDGLRRYFDHRIPTGDFLAAVLSNDLCDAVGRAAILGTLPGLILWLNHYAPPECWGSREKVAAWLKRPTKTSPIPSPIPSSNAAPAADASPAPAAAPATITDGPCACGPDCPNKEPLDMIAATLSGKRWDADTLDAIAAFIVAAGYTLEEPGAEVS